MKISLSTETDYKGTHGELLNNKVGNKECLRKTLCDINIQTPIKVKKNCRTIIIFIEYFTT